MADFRIRRLEGVLEIAIDNPATRNAFTPAMLQTLENLFAEAQSDIEVRSVLLLGSESVFSAGLAVSSLSDPEAYRAPTEKLLARLRAFPKPVVAAVQGPAVGFALALLDACDIVLAGESVLFSAPFTALALCPAWRLTGTLYRAAGPHRAAAALLLSEPFDARDALEFGFVSRICPEDAVADEARARALRLAKMSRAALETTKSLLRVAAQKPLSVDELEAQAYERLQNSPDYQKATEAFTSGQTPDFS